MSPRGREWLAFLIDWIVVATLIVGPLVVAIVALVYVVLPSEVRFVAACLVAIAGNLAAIWWQLLSDRTAPPSLGRKLLSIDRPISAWNNLRGRGF